MKGTYRRPKELAEALDILAANPDWRIVAGGTDHYPARVQPGPGEAILDVSAIRGLRGIHRKEAVYSFGANTTWTDIREATDLPVLFNGLKAAAAEVGGRQIQNRGTVAGNLCNASPAADGIPPLMSLDAAVVLTGPDGERRMPLSDFLTGYRQTARAPSELLTAIEVPARSDTALGGFLKLGARHYLVISIAMVAGVLEVDERGRVVHAAISVGACSEVARRLPELEKALIGRSARDLPAAVEARHFNHLTPIDDPRASADYRRDAAATLVRRLLVDLGTQSGTKEAA